MGTVDLYGARAFQGYNGSPRRRVFVGLCAPRVPDRKPSLCRRKPRRTAQWALEYPAAAGVDHRSRRAAGPRCGGRSRDGEGRRIPVPVRNGTRRSRQSGIGQPDRAHGRGARPAAIVAARRRPPSHHRRPSPANQQSRSAGASHPPTQSRRLVLGIVGASVLALIAVIALVIALVTQTAILQQKAARGRPRGPEQRLACRPGRNPGQTRAVTATVPPLPAFAPPPDLGANCQYPSFAGCSHASPSTRLDPAGCPPTRPQIPRHHLDQLRGDRHPARQRRIRRARSTASSAWWGNNSSTTPNARRLTNIHRRRVCCCAAAPRPTAPVAPAINSPTNTPPTSTRPAIPRFGRPCCTRAGPWPWPTNGPNTNGSQFSLVFRDSEWNRPVHGVRHDRCGWPGDARQDRPGGHCRQSGTGPSRQHRHDQLRCDSG